MVRRTARLRDRKSKPKMDVKVLQRQLDYHEGLSANQVKVILVEFGLGDRIEQFSEWMFGQTCPVVQRHNRDSGKLEQTGGVYEYDLFRWVENQKKGTPLIWD
jgi:hypothetical protein